jgi:hypothetical protein
VEAEGGSSEIGFRDFFKAETDRLLKADILKGFLVFNYLLWGEGVQGRAGS